MVSKSVLGDFGELAIAALGMATTAVTAFVLGYIAVEFDFALYSFIILFVIPAGAIAAGLAATSGYYFGALLFHKKPVGGILLNMVVASLSAFLLINYTVFYLLEYEGVPIRELINFWAYLDLDIRTTSLSIGIGSIEIDSTSELGLAGYIYAALQLVGFGLGGYFMFLFLMGNPYCNDCSRYRKRVFRQDRYTSDGDVLVGNVKAVAALFDERKYKDAGELHAVAMGNENPSKASHLRTRIDIHSCTACGTALLVFTTSKAKGHGWDAIADLSFSVLTEQTPDLHSGA